LREVCGVIFQASGTG